MANWVKLDNVTHAGLSVASPKGAAADDAVNQFPAFPTEFEQLQRDYPILFRRDGSGRFYAVVLLGLDRDENLFLEDGGWIARYVPALRLLAPFAPDPVGGLPLIDLDDPRVGTADGQPLFLRHGGGAPFLRHMEAVAEAVRHGRDSNAPFFAALVDHDLLRARTLDIEVGDGTTYSIADVFTIDEQRLATLPDIALAQLHRSGILRAATMAAASLANIARLIELKTARSR